MREEMRGREALQCVGQGVPWERDEGDVTSVRIGKDKGVGEV